MRLAVNIGSKTVDARQIRVRDALNEPGTASFRLIGPNDSPVDLTAYIVVELVGAQGTPVMAAHATNAEIDGEDLNVEASGSAQLAGSTIRGFWSDGVDPLETFHALARQVGFPEERLNVEGLDEHPEAVHTVDALVEGLPLVGPVTVGGVLFRPITPQVSVAGFAPIYDALLEWGFRPDSVAQVSVSAVRMYDAEEEGLDQIQRALDAVVGVATYGFTRLPWGGVLPFARDQIRAKPTLVPCVLVTASTSRRWLHGLGSDTVEPDLQLDALIAKWMPLLAEVLPVTLARSLRALRDASTSSRDPLARCQSLFDALEYFTAGTKLPKIVRRTSVVAAVDAIDRLDLPTRERERLCKVLSDANNAPLMAKVRYQADQDGTIVSDPEWGLLAKLRRSRNQAGHGDEAKAPEQHDLEWAASIVSRLIMHSWAASNARLVRPAATS
jgi:hypothetical protein